VVQGDDGRSTHIGIDGEPIHGHWFVDLDVFHKGFARARDAVGWTHVNKRGRPVYERRFAVVEPFYNGQARVERHDGALEVIDESGAQLVELRSPLRSEFAALSGDMVGFWKTRTISATVSLGLPDILPANTSQVAEQHGLRPDRAERLLRALGELGLVTRTGDLWSLTPRGQYLRTDHPLTLAGAALEYTADMSRMWGELEHAVSAEASWAAPDIFVEVASSPARVARHHRMLRSYAEHDYGDVSRALGLAHGAHVIDAGGGLGTLAEMIASRYASARVTVLDRPEVMRLAAAESVGERITLRSADLFAQWPVACDAVVFARVLHDWADEDAVRLLKRAREALPESGRVYIVEMVLDEAGFGGAMCDLHLLCVTGGRERNLSHYRALLDAAGFDFDEIRTLPALPSIVVGVAR